MIDKDVRDVILRIDINDINDSLVQVITDLVDSSDGKHSLVVNLFDSLNKYEVDLLSRKKKVNIEKEFVDSILALPQIKMRIK